MRDTVTVDSRFTFGDLLLRSYCRDHSSDLDLINISCDSPYLQAGQLVTNTSFAILVHQALVTLILDQISR